MALDLQQELKQAHALLDQLPHAKLGAVRSLLEVLLNDGDDDEELTEVDRRAIQTRLDSRKKHGTVSREVARADVRAIDRDSALRLLKALDRFLKTEAGKVKPSRTCPTGRPQPASRLSCPMQRWIAAPRRTTNHQ